MLSLRVVRGILIVMLLLIFMTISGCLENPSEGGRGYSSIPKLLLDYEVETGCFKIYVNSALGDYKYEYILINVDGNLTMENNTYVLSYKCARDTFDVYVEAAVDEDTIYQSTIKVSLIKDEENNIIVNIIDSTDNTDEKYEIPVGDLPWKKVLAQKE